MKMIKNTCFFLFFFIGINAISQNALKVEKFVLDNGFTVILNQDPNAKDVYGAVVVKAGSKNDPADATGMAHYLEHLLFKGTEELGSSDFSKEKPFMDSIIYYYDLLGKTKDDAERKKIQLLINNQSVKQSKLANPTEFDKLIKSIGGTGLNAFTANDMTVYHNEFPGNQIEKWLELYSHRFQKPVFRSFQSELEVVYEEKNRGMDSPFSKLFEEIQTQLFRTHPYGTQSTIGTTEHLKNPSLTKMYEYFNTYYVANNMALVISGNFDLEKTIPIIKEKFSTLRSAPIPVFPNYEQSKFEKKEIVEVKYTPIKFGLLGYKTVKKGDKDEIALDVFTRFLYNESETGVLNKLRLDGKIMETGIIPLSYNDDGAIVMYYIPKIVGQSFEDAESLVYDAIKKIKNGEFSDKDLQIIKQEITRQRKEGLENIEDRVMNLVQVFSEGSTWEDYLKQTETIEKLTKADIMKVANEYFGENHFVMHSSTGFPKKDILEKPGFKPVTVDKLIDSEYAKNFLFTIVSSESPRILDYNKDAQSIDLNASNKLYITPNPINDLFTLQIERMVGEDSIKNLDLAASLFNYFYTKDQSRDQLKEAFALLGITYFAQVNDNRFSVTFNGIEGNLQKALPLIKSLMYEPIADEASLKSIIEQIVSERDSEIKDPSAMGKMLLNYARFGEESDNLTRDPLKKIKKLTVPQIISAYKEIFKYNTTYHFIGTASAEKVKEMLTSTFPIENTNRKVEFVDKKTKEIKKNTVYFINDKNAVQSQVYFLVNTPNFSGNTTDKVNAESFNQYMSDGFSGILMQEIREYRSLAYTTSGAFINPIRKNNPGTFYSYVGCQGDKTLDAISVMNDILEKMPEKPERIEMIKAGLINSVSSNFPDFRSISNRIDRGRQMGYTQSPLVDEYKLYGTLTFNDIVSFYKSNIQSQNRVITVYGNAQMIDKKKLAEYGNVVELKLKNIKVY